jgi:riboflavin kinase
MTNSTAIPIIEPEIQNDRSKMVFPHFASGTVVKGFGRGSKQLGIPTANYPESVVEHLPEAFHNGVYYGLAQVDNGPVYRMVMSVGNNPFYNNEKRTMVKQCLKFYPIFLFNNRF